MNKNPFNPELAEHDTGAAKQPNKKPIKSDVPEQSATPQSSKEGNIAAF